MIHSRANARTAGILLILGTVPIILALAAWGRPLVSPDYLSLLAANELSTYLFIFTILVMGMACAGVGIALYPVLKLHDEGLALTAMGFRLMEGPLQFLSALCNAALLALSREFVRAGSPAGTFYQPAGEAIKAVTDWLNTAYFLPFCIGAFSYYLVFFRARLVPRWLSVWGLAGILLMLAAGLISALGLIEADSQVVTLLCFPIMVQEMVLAVRLIAKGFDVPGAAKAQAR